MIQVVRFRAAGFLLACGLCASCGYIGDPLPPALNIAMPIRDLRVVEYDDRLVIDFTVAPLTTEGLVLQRMGTVDLRVGPGATPFDASRWAAAARKIPLDAANPGPLHRELPAADWAGHEVVVGVRIVNPKGRASEWSNLALLNVIAPLPVPADVAAQSAPQGARITWQSPERAFRVFRRAPNEKQPALIGTTESPEYVDASAQFGTEYRYLVQALRDRAESRISAPVSITPRDTFPPAAPAGLSAVAGIGSIELVWDRNTEPDLRGYRVYRAADSGQLQRLSEFVDTPAYSDRQIETGRKYRYAITAIDQAGNESTMSAVMEIAAP